MEIIPSLPFWHSYGSLPIPVLAEEKEDPGDNSLSTLGITTEGVTVSPDFVYSTIEYDCYRTGRDETAGIIARLRPTKMPG